MSLGMRQPIRASGRSCHHEAIIAASVVADVWPLVAIHMVSPLAPSVAPIGAFVSGSTGNTSKPVWA